MSNGDWFILAGLVISVLTTAVMLGSWSGKLRLEIQEAARKAKHEAVNATQGDISDLEVSKADRALTDEKLNGLARRMRILERRAGLNGDEHNSGGNDRDR